MSLDGKENWMTSNQINQVRTAQNLYALCAVKLKGQYSTLLISMTQSLQKN
jgi:hypothetical protein